jgi:hypothetical protein
MLTNIEKILIIGDINCYSENKDTLPDWLLLLKDHYHWNEQNYTKTGVGSAYNIIKFLQNSKDFDLCIFVWGDVSRMLFNENAPDINMSSIRNPEVRSTQDHNQIYDAASLYYKYLVSNPITNIEHLSLLKGFDTHIKQQFSDKLFWHFRLAEEHESDDSNYSFYKFSHGLTIHPTLDCLNKLDATNVYSKFKAVVDQRHTDGVFVLDN